MPPLSKARTGTLARATGKRTSDASGATRIRRQEAATLLVQVRSLRPRRKGTSQARRDQPVLRVLLDPPARRAAGVLAWQGRKASRDLRAKREPPDHRDRLVHLAAQGWQDHRGRQGPLALREALAPPGRAVRQDRRASPDLPAKQEQPGRKATPALLARWVRLDRLGLPGRLAALAHRALPGRVDWAERREFLVRKGLLARLAAPARQVRKG